MQVNVLWSQAIEADSATHALVDNANLLRKHFLSQGFKKESIVVNQKLKGGMIMVFRGLDGEERSSELILIPSKQNNSPSSKPSALALRLSYKQNPSHPDIFHLPKGKF